jgi:metallo-beta-lactamase family protein
MHQGSAVIEKRNLNTKAYQAEKLDFILLTHAHIDHSGLLPRMVREGFTGPVYCTEPTVELLDIMLLDSAHIQEMEAEWANRKRARRGNDIVEALYTTEDAAKAAGLLKGVRYDEPFSPAPGVRVRFCDAGHILGSSFLELEVTEMGKETRLIFSGDLGRPNALIVNDPARPSLEADYLFLESTYGDRDHKNESTSRDELAEAIAHATANGQKTIIPAFAVERTQEVIYTLFLLHKDGKLPTGIPIYVDSPLAIKATEIFRKYPGYFDRATQDLLRKGEDPLTLPGLKYTLSAEESQAINRREGAAIVISASGMCNAGRIKHHLRHNLWRKGASIVFTGYQAVGTPGRKIVDGAESLTILGDEVKVAAKIYTIGGFSGHAGQSQMLDWVGAFCRPELKVFLVHGEERAQQPLAELLRQRYGLKVSIPAYLEEITLEPGKAPKLYMDDSVVAARKINWDLLLSETEGKLVQLRAGLSDVRQKSWDEQAEVREQMLDLNRRFLQLLSQL